MGKILWVDLTTRTVSDEVLEEAVYRDFLGGYGLGVKILYDHMPPGIDPLGPANILGFVPGLLTGTGTPFSGRFMVVCKSPLTGGWGDANCGGFFGPELRRCGYDGLFIRGAAATPVYLTLYKGELAFHDAADLWGQDALAAEHELKHRHGENWQVSTIGQAGEKLALIAGIVTDRGRLAARSGVGAVMGSKNLKAIAVKGHLPVAKADMDAFKRSTKAVMDRMHPMEPEPKGLLDRLVGKVVPPKFTKLLAHIMPHMRYPHQTLVWHMANQGTPAMLSFGTEGGDTPTKNWSGVGSRDFPFARAEKIGGAAAAQFNTKFYACSACPLHCGGEIKLDDPEFQIADGHRVEYESIAGLGAALLIDDIRAVTYAHHLCNLYGLDVISTGNVLGFAFECYERGLITAADTGGVALQWGNTRAMLALIELIAHRRLIGDVLANGVMRAAAQIGRGAEAIAIHVGGQELPYHDPRLTPSFGTTYVADPTPGRHTAGGAHVQEGTFGHVPFKTDVPRMRRYDYAGKGPTQAAMVKTKQVQQSVGLCEFSGFIATLPYEVMIKGACGWEMTGEELLRIGDRIQTLRQAFNCREGIRPADWRLPDRAAGRPPLQAGPTAGITIDVDAMVTSYMQAMDYDLQTGRPSVAKLRELGLQRTADDLYGAGVGTTHD